MIAKGQKVCPQDRENERGEDCRHDTQLCEMGRDEQVETNPRLSFSALGRACVRDSVGNQVEGV